MMNDQVFIVCVCIKSDYTSLNNELSCLKAQEAMFTHFPTNTTPLTQLTVISPLSRVMLLTPTFKDLIYTLILTILFSF